MHRHIAHRHIATFLTLTTLILPAITAQAQSDTQAEAAAPSKPAKLKTTPDPLPEGLKGFNGMLVGRLARKDVERGTFLVQVDAVPRVWRNSKAENPKSVVGKTVLITGVFGKFLDVLVVTRTGETVEFECKHDGDKLVFPGEMLRKVAAYDPADYPVLPEAFRGFRGFVVARVVKKDPQTFELIIKVERVAETWKNNQAKDAKSIEGKPLMLAGFWNRKDAYHTLKVGDRIKVGMQHIGLRSEHLTVAESIQKLGDDSKPEATGKEDAREEKSGEDRASRDS